MGVKIKVREWAEHHAREVEALEKRPHGALLFSRAIAGGSGRALGSAAELMTVHSAELAAAEATVASGLAGPSDHWKRWKADGLDSLGRTLGKGVLFFFGGGQAGGVLSCLVGGVGSGCCAGKKVSKSCGVCVWGLFSDAKNRGACMHHARPTAIPRVLSLSLYNMPGLI